jgi:hypothetical protein
MPKTLFFKNYKMGGASILGLCPYGVAYLAQGRAHFAGLNCSGDVRSQPLPTSDWASLRGWVAERFGDSGPIESEYEPGTAYKRIFQPVAGLASFHTAINTNARTQSFVALRLLIAKMVSIFENIEPAARNLHVYGHKVRELLLLAAMEAEASWAAILKANGYPPKDRLNTTDYVKLRDPMLLDSFSLALTSYPEFPSFAPLKDWDPKRPTQSLAWFEAYNATKHNREERLDAATLERAIHAVGATVVMFYAQFGRRPTLHWDESYSLIRSVFTEQFDTNKHPHSGYIADETISNSGLANPWGWKLVDYPFPP